MRFVMMALAVMLVAGSAQAASLDVYSQLPSMQLPLISPDGAKVAFIQRVNGKEAVIVDQLSPAGVIGDIPPGGPYSGMIWADANRLIIYGPAAAFVIDLEKRKVSRLMDKSDLPGVGAASLARLREGHTVVFLTGLIGVDGGTAAAFESVDLDTGKATRLAQVHSHQAAQWGIDPEGNLLYQTVYDQQTHAWTLQLRKGSSWVDALSATVLYDPPRVVGQTRDGKSLVLQRITDDHGLEFRSVSLADGKLGDLVPEYVGLTSIILDPQTFLPIGGLKEGMEPNYAFFDPKDQALWDGVAKVFPDEEVELVNWSRDRSKAVVKVTGLKHGLSYQIVDTATHKALGIGPLLPGLTPDDLADVHVASYPAKDGLQIQALLTLPVGRQPKNLPLVVLPHSGPGQHDEVGYDAWAQALASQGYAVLQPEYRGSSGFGWKLESAAFGEWGRKMQTDLSDGVRALASQGYIDPKRVCIVGGPGYAGYAALAGVTIERGVYRCAVAVNPWADLRKAAGGRDADAKHSLNIRNWERLIGSKDAADPIFDRLSPSKHAADANAPILIIHDRTSTDVPIDDSIALVNALKAARKTAELVLLDSVSQDAVDARRLKELQATVAFVEKNNPPN
jgi:dienelactone hydrolase